MTNSIRFAVIGLIGALMLPSLCSAQMIILHENWHGLGAFKTPSTAAYREQQRAVIKQQDQRLSQAPRTASHATERRQTLLGRADSGHPPVRVAEHRFHTSEMVASSQHSQVAAAAEIALTPTIPYDVIESPFRQPYREDTLHVRSKHHPPITRREGPRMGRAVIPNTMQMPVWKTPFSYGYFGTSGTKHWYGHHGYRDRRTVWSYR